MQKFSTRLMALVLVALGVASCGGEPSTDPTDTPTPTPQPFTLKSAAYANGEAIPVKYSCQGEDISPPLMWTDPPSGTQSFALIFDDPDAVQVARRVWDHWLLYNIPAETRALAEGASLPTGTLVGKNSWQKLTYGGPCPPPGKPHRYYFKLYALNTTLQLKSGATKAALLKAMEGHILAQVELMGTFARK